MKLTLAQVKQARRMVWNGRTVKEVAGIFGEDYQVVYNAVRGITWSSIGSPAPVDKGFRHEHRQRPRRTCFNCGNEYDRGGTTKRCGACNSYWHRHHSERQVETLYKQHQISKKEMEQLYTQYKQGVSLDALAEGKSFSAETLRRRFDELGYERRGTAGDRQRLTLALVRQVRQLVHEEGVQVSVLAARYGIHYQTLYTAVMGITWRAAGGPLPVDPDEVKRPCTRCGLLTGHHSSLCRYCR